LSTVITAANTHDVTVAIDTVDSIVIKRPSSSKPKYNHKKQNLYLDKQTIPKKESNKVSKGDTYHTYDIEERKRRNSIVDIQQEDRL
jgi:hypothetical protein